MSDFVARIVAELDDSNFRSQIKSLLDEFNGSKINIEPNLTSKSSKNLENIGKQVGKSISNGMDSASSNVKGTASQLSNLISLTKQINSSSISVGKLDTSKNAAQVNVLKDQIAELQDEANELFKSLQGELSSDQVEKFGIVLQQLGNRLDEANAKIRDAKFEEYIASLNKVSNIQFKLDGLDSEKNADKIKVVTKELKNAKEESAKLEEEVKGLSVDGKFTADQEKRIANERELLKLKQDSASADASDAARESARQATESNRVKQLNAQFNELLKTKKDIAAIDIKLAKLNPDTDSAKIAGLQEDRNKLDEKAFGIQTAIGSDMSVDWQRQLDEVDQNANSTISEIRNGQADKQALADEAKKAKNLKATYDKLISAKEEMAQIERSVEKLDSTDDSRAIERKIARYEELSNQVDEYYRILQDGMSKEQMDDVDKSIQELDTQNKRKLEDQRASQADKSDVQAEAASLRQRNEAVEEFINLQCKIGSKKAEIAVLDPSKDIELINQLESELDVLENKAAATLSSIDGGLNDTEHSNWLDVLRKSSNQLDEIKAKAKDVARQNDINENYNELLSTLKTINGLKIKIAGLDPEKDAAKIAEYEKEIEELTEVYRLFEEETKGKLSIDQKSELANEAQETETALRRVAAANEDNQRKLADSDGAKAAKQNYTELIKTLNELDSLLVTQKKLELSGKTDTPEYQEVSNQIDVLTKKTETLEGALGESLPRTWVQQLDDMSAKTTRRLELLEAQDKSAKAELAKNIDNNLTNGKYESQISTLEAKFRSTGKESKEVTSLLEQLRQELKNVDAASTDTDKIKSFEQFQNTLQKCNNEINIIQQRNKGFNKTFSSITASIAQFAKTYLGIQEVFNTLKKGVQAVIDLDYALIDLKKTTTMTGAELDSFYLDANNVAKEMGVTTQEIIDQASAWSRLGYSSKEEATEMAKLSSMFATISPGMSVDTATEGLVSVMKAYGYEVEDVMDGIMSKINIVGNTAATSNDEIITGLQNSASAMAAMDTTLDETIALFTAGQEITQDASKTGNALRSMSMRIRGYDEETDELSEDLANITGEVVNLTKVASNNNQGVSLFTDASQTQYKSIYQYLSDISEIYDELDQKSQQELLEKLFGKNRANVGAAIITNFNAAEEAMDNMANSAGSAESEMAIATDSIKYKINDLSETWTGIAQTVFQRDDVKAVVDILITLSEAIGAVVEQFGLVKTIGAGAGIFAFVKNLG